MNEYEYKVKITGFKKIIIPADNPEEANKTFWKIMEEPIVIEVDEQLNLITSGPYTKQQEQDLLEDVHRLLPGLNI